MELRNISTLFLVCIMLLSPVWAQMTLQEAQSKSQPTLFKGTNGRDEYKLFYNHKVKWIDAFESCKAENSDLLSIDDVAELSNIRDFLNSSGMPNRNGYHVWTSGSDLYSEGQHIWMSNGKKVSNTLYSPRQPDNAGAGENCDELWIADDLTGTERDNYLKYFLNDRPCNVLNHFMCKRRWF